jgi:hypothetical protein
MSSLKNKVNTEYHNLSAASQKKLYAAQNYSNHLYTYIRQDHIIDIVNLNRFSGYYAMKEEQAVLDFFAQAENFPLGLSVAEQMDEIRQQMNNRLWRELLERLRTLVHEHGLAWRVEPTEDKNSPENLVGLHCTANTEQRFYLRPMLEQQYLGGVWRIYFGLMWSVTPTPDQLGLPAVSSLKSSLQKAGFKSNEGFLAWQWTSFHPRRKDFLLRYAQQPEKLLDDVETLFRTLLIEHGVSIEQANAALQTQPRGLGTALDQLRNELIDQ